MENTELPLMYPMVHVAFLNILEKWSPLTRLQVRGENALCCLGAPELETVVFEFSCLGLNPSATPH